jgi:hypothetical protein
MSHEIELDYPPIVLGAIGIAEEFLAKGYLKECIQCLEGTLLFEITRYIDLEVKIRLRLGKILMKYTSNYEKAKIHLEKAVICLITYPVVKIALFGTQRPTKLQYGLVLSPWIVL